MGGEDYEAKLRHRAADGLEIDRLDEQKASADRHDNEIAAFYL